MFGNDFAIIDSNKNMNASPEDFEHQASQHKQVFKQMQNFVSSPSKYQAAKDWYRYQAALRNLNPDRIVQHQFARQTPEERKANRPPKNSEAIDYSKLSNYSLGQRVRWGDKKAKDVLDMRYKQKVQDIKSGN